MPNHVEYVRRQCRDTVHALGESIGQAVAVTDQELVLGREALFGRWGGKLERFPLRELVDLELVPNPSTDLLRIYFTNRERPVLVMYSAEAKAEFADVVRALRHRLELNGGWR